MSKRPSIISGLVRTLRPTALAPMDSRQVELFPLTTSVEIPAADLSADAWGWVEASDLHDYIVKTDERGGPGIRASEWIGTHLAEELNMPCPTAKVIELNNGTLCFGSRKICGIADLAITAQILTSTTLGSGAASIPGLQSLLSALYVADMFLLNVDRHDENYLSVDDRGTRRFYAIDFGRSLFWHPNGLFGFPLVTQPTRTTFKRIVARHGFDMGAANAMLDRLASLGSEKLRAALSTMPDSWLETTRRVEFIGWWEGDERQRRVAALREGLSNGTLL